MEGRKGGGRDRRQCRCRELGGSPQAISHHQERPLPGIPPTLGRWQQPWETWSWHKLRMQQLGPTAPYSPCSKRPERPFWGCHSLPLVPHRSAPPPGSESRASLEPLFLRETQKREEIGRSWDLLQPVSAVNPILPHALNSLGRCYLVVSPNLRSSG